MDTTENLYDTGGQTAPASLPAELLRRLGTLDSTELVTTTLGVRITHWQRGRLVATLPVAGNRDPYGRLDSAVYAVLAETLGSVAAALDMGTDGIVLGQELSCVHHEAVLDGTVTGVCTPLHRGDSTAAYEIVITDADARRLCTARLTCRLRRTPVRVPAPDPAPTTGRKA